MGSAVINEAKKRQDYNIVSISRRGKVDGGDNDDGITWVSDAILSNIVHDVVCLSCFMSAVMFIGKRGRCKSTGSSEHRP